MSLYCSIAQWNNKKKDSCCYFIESATASLHLHATTNCSTIPPFTSPTPSDVPPCLPSSSVLDLSLSRQQHILLHSSDSPFVTSRRCTSAASCAGPTGRTHVPHNGWIVLLSRFYLEATLKSVDRQRASVCLAESASTHCCVGGQRRCSGSAYKSDDDATVTSFFPATLNRAGH